MTVPSSSGGPRSGPPHIKWQARSFHDPPLFQKTPAYFDVGWIERGSPGDNVPRFTEMCIRGFHDRYSRALASSSSESSTRRTTAWSCVNSPCDIFSRRISMTDISGCRGVKGTEGIAARPSVDLELAFSECRGDVIVTRSTDLELILVVTGVKREGA